MFSTTANNLLGNFVCEAFFTELAKHVGKLSCVGLRKKCAGRLSKRCVKSQVQRGAGSKTEAALFIGELVRRETEVDKDRVDRRSLFRREEITELSVTRLMGCDVNMFGRGLSEVFAGQFQHHGIAIDPNQRAARREPGSNVS